MFGVTCMLLRGLLALHFRAADRGCPSAPGLPCALFTEEGNGNEQNSGVCCRESADSCSLQQMKWCCQTGLNCRPLHYQWSALPLSYGSMCWDKNRPPEGPTKRADICHRPPRCASLQALPKRENGSDIGDNSGVLAGNDRLAVDFGSACPGQLASWPVRRIRPILSFARSGPRGPLELPHSLGMLSPTAVWTRDG